MNRELKNMAFCKILYNQKNNIESAKKTLEHISNNIQVFFAPLDNSFVFISDIEINKNGILKSIEQNISSVINDLDVDIQTQSVYICGESTNEGNNNSIAFWKFILVANFFMAIKVLFNALFFCKLINFSFNFSILEINVSN